MNADGTVKTPNPNLRIFEVSTGKLLATLIADKQSVWKPHFTDDDSIAIRVKGSEILFYKNGEFGIFFKFSFVASITSDIHYFFGLLVGNLNLKFKNYEKLGYKFCLLSIMGITDI